MRDANDPLSYNVPSDVAALLAHLKQDDHAMAGTGMDRFDLSELQQIHWSSHRKESPDHSHPDLNLNNPNVYNVDDLEEGSASFTQDVYRALDPDLAGWEVRDSEDGAPVLSVRFAAFNEWAEIDSLAEGHFMERFAPGSLDDSLARETPKILFNHGKDILGKQVIAAPVTARTDERFGYLEAPLLDGVPPLIASGLRHGVYGASMQFHAQEQEVVRHPKRSEHNPQGLTERTVTKAGVREGGPVTWGAYSGASASIRSLTDEFVVPDFGAQLDRMVRDHPQELAAVIQRSLKGSEPEPPQPKASVPPRFRSREEYLQWLWTSNS